MILWLDFWAAIKQSFETSSSSSTTTAQTTILHIQHEKSNLPTISVAFKKKSPDFGSAHLYKGGISMLEVNGWKWETGCLSKFTFEHSSNQTPLQVLNEFIEKVNLLPPPSFSLGCVYSWWFEESSKTRKKTSIRVQTVLGIHVTRSPEAKALQLLGVREWKQCEEADILRALLVPDPPLPLFFFLLSSQKVFCLII